MKSLVVCLVGLLVSVQASPVSPPVISGQVRLSDGSPVAGAQVVLFDVADLAKGPVGQATTDEAGLFALPLAARAALVLPQGFALGPNYPNPFNPSTIIPYQLTAPSPVRLEVFNILGQHMATLVDEEQAAGSYRARWDGTDAAGRAAASGVYFYRLTVAGVHQTGRMVLVDGQVGVPAGGPRVAAVPLTAGSTGTYGLVVSGDGLVAYVDAAFSVAVGQGPVALVVEMQPKARGKVGPVEPAVEAQPTVWRKEVPMLDGLLGDMNNNGQVDIDDGLLGAMYSVDPSLSLPNHGQIALGDVNCNGQVELEDAALLATYAVNPSAAAVSSLRIGQRGGYSLNPVTEMVWASILGTEQQDATVARLLDAVPVLISGVFDIDGRDYLYLGIDRDYYERHGGKHIYTTLEKRFPVTPLIIEPSDGVQTQATETPAPLLLDTFEAGLGAWQADSGWQAQPLDRAATIPGEGEGNLVARTQGCSFCLMTLKTPMDLSAYESVTLSFYRWLDADTGELEFFGVDLGNKGLYKRVKTYGQEEGDGQWHPETVTLTGQDLSDAFTLRFFGMARKASTTFAIDNVMLTPTPGTVVVEPDPPPPQDEAHPNLTIASLSISPTNPASGTPVTVRLTVRNAGTETARSETVRLYRHRTRTSTPTIGGTRLSATTTTGSLAPGASVTRTLSVTTPSVTTTTTFYYYACADSADGETETDDNCSTAPATVTVQPTVDATPEQPPDLAIPSVTASPTNPEPGGLITMQIAVHNLGAGSASSEIIRVYRHAAPTADPTVNGARIAQTARSGSLAAGASATRTLSTVVPSVPSDATYYYYACVDAAAGEQQTGNNCSLAPAEVRVQPRQEALFISPNTTESGTQVAARITTKNTGIVSAEPGTVHFYRHQSRTSNPTIGGTRLAITDSLTLGTQETKTIIVPVPSVTTNTTFYYYACVESADGDSCSDPAEVQVMYIPDAITHGLCPPEGTLLTPLGGEAIFFQNIGQPPAGYSCTTITLGGLETIDGTRGFIVSGHAAAQSDQSDISSDTTDVLVGNRSREDQSRLYVDHLLGKVFKMPSTRVEGEKKILSVDAAFVKYPSPQTPGCSLKWQKGGESFCLDDTDKNDYIDRITPLTIRGRDGDTYRVVGSKEPIGGLEVTYSGAISGPGEKIGNVVGGVLIFNEKRNSYFYGYYVNTTLGTVGGDSGSPFYTPPDTNGNVHIVGVLTGYVTINDSEREIFSSWGDVADEFNLKPISP